MVEQVSLAKDYMVELLQSDMPASGSVNLVALLDWHQR
jgi:hypothetical protein